MKKLFVLLLALCPTQQYAGRDTISQICDHIVNEQNARAAGDNNLQTQINNLVAAIKVIQNQNTILTAEITNLRNEKNQEKAALQEIIRRLGERLGLTQAIPQPNQP